MSKNSHTYSARLVWDGNLGDGTTSYAKYGRQYRVLMEGKPELAGSADAAFRGNAARHNPEDLFVAALSSCHLLSYLALCARNGVNVVAYEDDASGVMTLTPDGGGAFDQVTLRPKVTIAAGGDEKKALELHEKAHEQCFIANSVKIPVHHEATVSVDSGMSADSESNLTGAW
jgi:organic hydroperoxide reductase OsmC/OhrA